MLDDTKIKITSLISSFHDGKKLTSGYTIAIVGAPNAGKSSLLNALLDEDRAIVTNIAGTTRDTIEEEITLDGYTFTFIDTAGIRKSSDTIEQIGIEKSYKALEEADITLLLIDLNEEIPEEIPTLLTSKNDIITVYNKTDIAEKENPLKAQTPIYISAKEKLGLEELKKGLKEKVHFENIDDTPVITKERHYAGLKETLQSLEDVQTAILNDLSIELISFDLREG